MNESTTDRDKTVPENCPCCGGVKTKLGQPSARWFYSCDSYLYAGDTELRDQTDLCFALGAVKEAVSLLQEISAQAPSLQGRIDTFISENT
jgi:hypothetical protein